MIPKTFLDSKKQVFDKCGFELNNFVLEKESNEYGACQFELNENKIIFRVGKITPTKTGQFVTLWKRIGKGPIQPFDITDAIAFFVISTKTENRLSQFVFSKALLLQQGVLTSDLKEGKRAIRLYPPWDKPDSKQAQKTQKWQLDSFLEIPLNQPIDIQRAKMLYQIENK